MGSLSGYKHPEVFSGRANPWAPNWSVKGSTPCFSGSENPYAAAFSCFPTTIGHCNCGFP